MGFSIGLDFGTSNSTVTICENGTPRLLPVEGQSGTIPSALFFDFENGTDHFGRDAIALYSDGGGGRLMRSLKSVLGTSLMADSTRIRGKLVSFEDILGKFIRHLKTKAESQLGGEISNVVLGRPVHFIDEDQEADTLAQATLEKIVRRQGFKHISFQLEPIAAALDYERSLTAEKLVMIADIGGGTADFTVARLVPPNGASKSQVLANGGVHVGGTDMDRVLSVSQVMPMLGLGSTAKDGKRNLPVWPFNDLATWHRINSLSDAKALSQMKAILKDAAKPELFERLIEIVEHRDGHRLAGQVEDAKVALSSKDRHFAKLVGVAARDIEFLRVAFEHDVARLVERLRETCLETLTASGIVAPSIDAVFLTGGTCQIPLVRQMLEVLFPKSEFVSGDVFGSVGLGLAIEAERVFG